MTTMCRRPARVRGAGARARSSGTCRSGSCGRDRRSGRPSSPSPFVPPIPLTATSPWIGPSAAAARATAPSTAARSRMSQASACVAVDGAAPWPRARCRSSPSKVDGAPLAREPGRSRGRSRCRHPSRRRVCPSFDLQLFAICEVSVAGYPCPTLPQSIDCRCAEHGTRVGRSSPGGQYAEAEGQSGKWTKAHPARRIPGPVLLEHTTSNARCALCKENVAKCVFTSRGRLTRCGEALVCRVHRERSA